MMISILGQDINIVRPRSVARAIVYSSERPRPRYGRTRTIKSHCGRVAAVCIRLKNGGIRSIRKGIHADVMNIFGIDPKNVSAVGWELENGEMLWRR